MGLSPSAPGVQLHPLPVLRRPLAPTPPHFTPLPEGRPNIFTCSWYLNLLYDCCWINHCCLIGGNIQQHWTLILSWNFPFNSGEQTPQHPAQAQCWGPSGDQLFPAFSSLIVKILELQMERPLRRNLKPENLYHFSFCFKNTWIYWSDIG